MLPRHYSVPDPVTGYILNPERGFFSVILPEQTTNMLVNPSFEAATTGWAALGSASIARSAVQQFKGAYSLAITMTAALTDGATYSGALALVSGTTYTASAWVIGQPGRAYTLSIDTSANVALAGTTFTATGRWQLAAVTYTETASNTRRVSLRKSSQVSTTIVYLDAVQVEAKAYATTYCDGDQLGFVPGQTAYQWTGTPHVSTSTRSAQTRAGGKVVNLDDYGFKVLSYIGLGMAALALASTPFALGDGAQFQRATAQPREFALAGQFDAPSLLLLQRLRSDMHAALAPSGVAQQQPLVLRYQAHNCFDPTGPVLDLVCNYTGGLEGNTDNLYGERAALRFTQFLPFVQSAGSQGAVLGHQTSIASVNNILQRSTDGTWSALSTGANAAVNALARPSDETLFAGGNFTDAGGSGADYLARWSGTAWSVVGSATALNSTVYALAVAPDGVTVYVGGNFTNANGVAAADYIASWNQSTSTWAALGTGMNNTVRALTVGPDGTLYALGDFTTAGGGAAAQIAQWNGSAWSALGTGITGGGTGDRALVIGTDGALYAGGDHTSAGGVADTNWIAKWDGSAWSALGTSLDAGVRSLAIGPDGILYVGGGFSDAGGVAVQGVAQWNGAAWSPLSSGLNTGPFALVVRQGSLYAGGGFSTAGGFTIPGGLAVWTGSAWVPPDVEFVFNVASLHTTRAGVLTVGYNIASGTAIAATVTTVTNSGSATAAPRIVFTGPGRVYSVVNTTTGDALYFNLTLLAGETATLDLTPNNISFVSTFRGNIINSLIPGSQLSSFRLLPGANSISVFISGTVTAATSVTMIWTPAYLSVDDATE